MMVQTERFRILGLLAAFGIVFWVTFYPGFMSIDSIKQFEMSQSLHFNDWHPPLMSWVWSILAFFFPGPSGMLALHTALVWLAVYLWWSNFKHRANSWLVCVIPFLPWVLNFAGVLWKDVGLAFSLFALSGLVLRQRSPGKVLLALTLVFYAINLRHNAIFAVFPILMLLSYRWLDKRSCIKALIISGAIIFLACYAGNVFNYQVLGAQKTSPSSYMMVDDLAYLSIKNNESYLPGVEIDEIRECAALELGQNRLVGRVFCLSNQPSYKKANSLQSKLKSIWLAKIIAHPSDYLEFRMAAFSYLLRTPNDPPYYLWHPGIDENSLGFKKNPNGLTLVAEKAVKGTAVAAPFLFKPYWWLLSSLLLLGATFCMAPSQSVLAAQALLASSIVYILGYLPVTPMADFRYVYWSVIATSLTFIVLLVDWPGIRSTISRRRIVVVSLFALICGGLIPNFGKIAGVNIDNVLNSSILGARKNIEQAPVAISDLVEEKGMYVVKGVDPYFIYDISSFKYSSKDVAWLKFEFSCAGSSSPPELQLFWWGDDQQVAPESQSATRRLVEGTNLIPMRRQFGASEFNLLRGIRLDLATPGACQAINIKALQFVTN